MAIFGLILILVGLALVAFGAVLFANGAGTAPERSSGSVGGDARHTFGRLPWQRYFGLMPSSIKGMTDSDAGRDDRLKAAGAFCGAAGIVLLLLAILALLTALL